MAFIAKSAPRPCPVKGCSGRVLMRVAMRVHFWNRHVQDTVVILEKFNLPHPWFPLCDIMVPWMSLNGMHRLTAQCKRGAEMNQRRLAAEEEMGVISRTLSTYGRPLDMLTSF